MGPTAAVSAQHTARSQPSSAGWLLGFRAGAARPRTTADRCRLGQLRLAMPYRLRQVRMMDPNASRSEAVVRSETRAQSDRFDDRIEASNGLYPNTMTLIRRMSGE